MTKFAAKTEVSTEKSRAEIESTLKRYGATGFAYAWQERRAMIQFEMHNRRIKFELPLPDPKAREFTHTVHRYPEPRTAPAALKLWEQACRQRWRALALAIKAKLEAVECNITDFESEFLAHICLPNGQTVGGYMLPQIAETYASGSMPPLLPGPKA
jgi:hypothetical protein